MEDSTELELSQISQASQHTMVSKLFSIVLLAASVAYARDCTWFGKRLCSSTNLQLIDHHPGTAPLCNGHCQSPHNSQITRGGGGGGNGKPTIARNLSSALADA